jgi:hypothetical protein
MEANGIVNMFSRSDEKYGARYINYIDDGHTKTYQAVLKVDPYGVPNKKIQCVGHVQKRMGSRLRKLKDEYRGKKLCDKKPLSGKGLLTDVVIDQLTTNYGNHVAAADELRMKSSDKRKSDCSFSARIAKRQKKMKTISLRKDNFIILVPFKRYIYVRSVHR